MSKGKMTTGSEGTVTEMSERRGERLPAGAPGQAGVPDPEVSAKPTRRRFTTEYKLRMLREAERQRDVGAIGALLRREGLYSTHLSAWRRQREGGALAALGARRRGRKPDATGAWRQRITELEAETARLQERLRQAEAIITAQKKLSEILGWDGTPTAPRESA